MRTVRERELQDKCELLEEEVRALKRMLYGRVSRPTDLLLTPMESRVYNCLVKNSFASMDMLERAAYQGEEPATNGVNALMYKLRKKLHDYNVKLVFKKGYGYYLR